MARFIRTARAEEDLIEIWLRIAAESPAAADRLLDQFDDAFQVLADNPRIGAARPDLADGLRYLVVGQYLALYRLAGSDVEIVRIEHGARDLPSLIR